MPCRMLRHELYCMHVYDYIRYPKGEKRKGATRRNEKRVIDSSQCVIMMSKMIGCYIFFAMMYHLLPPASFIIFVRCCSSTISSCLQNSSGSIGTNIPPSVHSPVSLGCPMTKRCQHEICLPKFYTTGKTLTLMIVNTSE